MPSPANPSPSQASPVTARITPPKLLKYFRACLADADLINPNLRSLEVFELSRGHLLAGTVPLEFVDRSFEIAEEDRRRKLPPKAKKKLPPLRRAPLLVAPLVLSRRAFHGWISDRKETLLYPLWICALLDRSGRLYGDPLHPPWIPRQFLEPVTGDAWTLGMLEAFDSFLTREEPPVDEEWPAVLTYAQDLFQAVSGEMPSEYQLEDFEVLGPRFAVQQIEKGFRKPLIDLADFVLGIDPAPAVLQSLARAPGAKPAAGPDDPGAGGGLSHLGQMTGRFPLGPSQRQSLACALELRDGEILAVNGPPGTGKTTLVQSIVASLWVQRALEGSEPPLIHVCSTNNQAVTNVLDSFDAAAENEKEGLATRWLPEIRSYGLFFPAASQTRNEPEKKYQTAELAGNTLRGSLGEMETSRYVKEAHSHYLDRAQGVLGFSATGLTVDKVVTELRRQLRDSAADLKQRLESTARRAAKDVTKAWDPSSLDRRLGALEGLHQDRSKLRAELLGACRNLPWYLELFDFFPAVRRRRDRWLGWPLIERELPTPELGSSNFETTLLRHVRILLAPEEEEAELLRWIRMQLTTQDPESPLSEALASTASPIRAVPLFLDVGLRHRLFQLAARYWEGRWLQEMEELFSASEHAPMPLDQARLLRFRRLAKLTPALVSTLFRSPRVFDYYDREEGRAFPLIGALDLLIVDEAGQVAPEIGAAVLPLAKRAIVIGDEHQIEPIWGIHRRVDSANLRAAGLDAGSQDLDPFRCSSSSLLRLAQRATRWTASPRRDGLFLREHRRCVPQIISYCNQLVYGGQLEPHREALPSSPLPAFGWAHVRSEAKRVRGSWANAGEAWAIARWLHGRREEIEAFYDGRPLEELVGVVTPFSAQRTELIKALTPKSPGRRKEGKGAGKGGGSGKKDAVPIAEIGTVHTFQGAEREIMIFSPVYCAETAPKKRFFDDGKNMLNVAVSRAKDAFLVFGDMELFDPMSPGPSGVLATHIFEVPENEIGDVAPSPDLWRQAEAGKLPARQLLTLEDHREALREALRESQEQVLIVSPYLTRRAIEADGIDAALRQAHHRGVEVKILYCVDLHRRPEVAAEVAEDLRQCGAEVHPVPRIHSKLLAVDRRWYIDGSFNWLGAVRDTNDPYHRLETSTRLEFIGVDLQIDKAWKEVERRITGGRG